MKWDTAGQERFRTITTAYYRGAMGILLVYDVTDPKSFESLYRIPLLCHVDTDLLWRRPTLTHRLLHLIDIDTWYSNVEQHASEGVDKILVGNKRDWSDKRAVSEEDGLRKADELGISFIETSAKDNENVEKAFFDLARFVL